MCIRDRLSPEVPHFPFRPYKESGKESGRGPGGGAEKQDFSLRSLVSSSRRHKCLVSPASFFHFTRGQMERNSFDCSSDAVLIVAIFSMLPTKLERPAQAFVCPPSEESLFGPPSSPSPEASPPRSAMPLILKGRWVDDKLEGRWVDDNDPAVPLVLSLIHI